MTDGNAHEPTAEARGQALMPVQAGVVVWTRRQLLAAAGFHEVRDTTLALERIRKGIRSKVWKEAVRCAETMLDIAGVKKPDEDAANELQRVRAIEITVVESGQRAEAAADTEGLELRAGGGDGGEA